MKFIPQTIPSCSNENFCFHVGDYSFGFQAQEQDEEMWGGSVTYKYRVEDPRLGRFFSVDPLHAQFPWNSGYAFSENSTIAFLELEGLEKIGVWEVQSDGSTLKLRVFNWQTESKESKEAWMLGWNVDEDYFKGHESEFWTTYSRHSAQGSCGTYWERYAMEESYKNGDGKPYDEDWSGDWWERAIAFDCGLSDPENGIPFALTVCATILTAGSWVIAAEAAGGLGAAIVANSRLFAWDAFGLTLDIIGLTQDPLGVTVVEEFFGAQNNSVVGDWASVVVSTISQKRGLVNLGVTLKDGSTYQIVFDAVNQVFATTKSYLDMISAAKATTHEKELCKEGTPAGQ